MAGVVRRIRERNLRQELREAQYLLQETAGDDERTTLERRGGAPRAQLGRVQLERSRSALYTSAPNEVRGQHIPLWVPSGVRLNRRAATVES